MSGPPALRPPPRRSWVEQIMGMPISVLARGEDAHSAAAEAAVAAVYAELRDVDAAFSTYLELRNVTAGYTGAPVLHDVHLVVPDGATVALLGPNGAGKTTLLRVAAGTLRPMRGRLVVDGVDVTGRQPHDLVRHGVCTVPEGRAVFPGLTVTPSPEALKMTVYLAVAAQASCRAAGLVHVAEAATQTQTQASTRAQAPTAARTVTGSSVNTRWGPVQVQIQVSGNKLVSAQAVV